MVTWNASGEFTYNPNGMFDDLLFGDTATDTFTYTASDGHGGSNTASVLITINGQNDFPQASDDTYITDEDTLLTVAVGVGLLSNDADPDTGDTLTISSVDTSGTLGTVAWNEDGNFTYDPRGKFDDLKAGDPGTDIFSYKISDEYGDLDTATVTITINGVPNASPVASDDSYQCDKFSPCFIPAPGLLSKRFRSRSH